MKTVPGPRSLEKIVRAFARRQPANPVYLVGGAVRDRLLGLPVTDFDFAVGRGEADLARELEGAGFGRAVRISSESSPVPVWRLAGPRWTVDIARFEKDGSIEDDLGRRDFTANALAREVVSGRLVDPFGGRADFRRRRIRMIAPANLDADPIRILRAYRLAATLGWTIEPKTRAALAARAATLAGEAKERIRAELVRLFGAKTASRPIAWASSDGVLAAGLRLPGTLPAAPARILSPFDAPRFEARLRFPFRLATLLFRSGGGSENLASRLGEAGFSRSEASSVAANARFLEAAFSGEPASRVLFEFRGQWKDLRVLLRLAGGTRKRRSGRASSRLAPGAAISGSLRSTGRTSPAGSRFHRANAWAARSGTPRSCISRGRRGRAGRSNGPCDRLTARGRRSNLPEREGCVDLSELLKFTTKKGASDLHLKPMRPPLLRLNGKMVPLKTEPMSPKVLEEMLLPILTPVQRERLERDFSVDIGYGLQGVARFRCNIFTQRGSYAAGVPAHPVHAPDDRGSGAPRSPEVFRAPPGRARPDHRPDRLGKIHDARGDHARDHREAPGSRRDDRGPDRIPPHRRPRAPSPSARSGPTRPAFARGAAQRPAPGPRRHHGRRDARPSTPSRPCSPPRKRGTSSSRLVHTNSAAQTIDRIIDHLPGETTRADRATSWRPSFRAIISLKLVERADGNGLTAAVEILRQLAADREADRDGRNEGPPGRNRILGAATTGCSR